MGDRAKVLVYGATGYTGGLVCEAMRKRGIVFAIAGRSAAKLASLGEKVGAAESCVVDAANPETIRSAVLGRAMVSACAGPFLLVGEPILATCARAGVHYVDTTGEQAFVARAVTHYRATAEASGACIAPAMGFEIAIADWGAHLARERLGGPPDVIDILYASRAPKGTATSRGTKRSALAQIGAGGAMQFVDGALVLEPLAAIVRTFALRSGREVTAVSFPSPESVLVPSHTGARTVRTFMPLGPASARALHLARGVAPFLARAGERLFAKSIDRAEEGPDAAARAEATFEVVIEARRGEARVTLRLVGHDPYGLTAEIQAYAAERALAGDVKARGVVAPSVAFDAARATSALSSAGLAVL